LKQNLTAERLRELLHYDPGTGEFTWLVSTSNRVRAGETAGTTDGRYRQIKIDGRIYRSHQLAWLYVTGKWSSGHLDHINGDPSDNRLTNLRPATSSQNGANSRKGVNNKSGFKGVSWHAQNQRWRARIMVGRRQIFLGLFADPAAAHTAYITAAKEYFGEYARAA
jgi:hypothetical protein